MLNDAREIRLCTVLDQIHTCIHLPKPKDIVQKSLYIKIARKLTVFTERGSGSKQKQTLGLS